MVHALELAAGMLAPGGQVADIRALDERAEFLVPRPGGGPPRSCGFLRETDEGIEYRQAEAALKEALARGVLTLVSEQPFTFRHHASSLPAMRAYLADTWTDAIIDPDVAAAIEAALAAAGPGAELVLRESGWMRVLTAGS
ncbi:MAG: hypothetical protein H6Q10_2351 [Acidobacteria bacterium]|nr:hypothetical protein [Acidobacteriota bacterium]